MNILSPDQLKKLSTPRLLALKKTVTPQVASLRASFDICDDPERCDQHASDYRTMESLRFYENMIINILSGREHVVRPGKPTPAQKSAEVLARRSTRLVKLKKRGKTALIAQGKARVANQAAA